MYTKRFGYFFFFLCPCFIYIIFSPVTFTTEKSEFSLCLCVLLLSTPKKMWKFSPLLFNNQHPYIEHRSIEWNWCLNTYNSILLSYFFDVFPTTTNRHHTPTQKQPHFPNRMNNMEKIWKIFQRTFSSIQIINKTTEASM